MSFKKAKNKANLEKLYLSFYVLKFKCIRIHRFTMKYLLPEVFADYFTVPSNSHRCNTQNISIKNFTYLKCTILKGNHHVNI